MYVLLYNVTIETIEGKTIELANRLERSKAAELVHRLSSDVGEELLSVDAQFSSFEPILCAPASLEPFFSAFEISI